MLMPLQVGLLVAGCLYQAIATWWEDQQPPPGQRIDVGGYRLHLCVAGEVIETTRPTIVIDHSLGGVEGYLLMSVLASQTRVCIYDRAGYGWSDRSPHPRTSEQIVTELDTLLTKAGIAPPYLLVGNSFGSYNMRLYAHRFPEKVMGLVLTDGLDEGGMLKLSLQLQALKLFFMSGFVMSTLGAAIGVIRLLQALGMFEWLKPELRQFPRSALAAVQRSFRRPHHWLTMTEELFYLDTSGRQVRSARPLGHLPLVSIKASSFFQPALWTSTIPLQAANQVRDQMHLELLTLSTQATQLQADQSGHFVWVDQPEVILKAVQIILEQST